MTQLIVLPYWLASLLIVGSWCGGALVTFVGLYIWAMQSFQKAEDEDYRYR